MNPIQKVIYHGQDLEFWNYETFKSYVDNIFNLKGTPTFRKNHGKIIGLLNHTWQLENPTVTIEYQRPHRSLTAKIKIKLTARSRDVQSLSERILADSNKQS
jgi:hypothetical protein